MLLVRDIAAWKGNVEHLGEWDDQRCLAGLEINLPDAGIRRRLGGAVRVRQPCISLAGPHVVNAPEIGGHRPAAIGAEGIDRMGDCSCGAGFHIHDPAHQIEVDANATTTLTPPAIVRTFLGEIQSRMNTTAKLEQEQVAITRRRFIKLGALGVAAASVGPLQVRAAANNPSGARSVEHLEYLTREENFVNVGRGNPPPHELSVEKRRAAGLTRETWRLEVVPDPDSDAQVERPLSKVQGNAFTWEQLMTLAEKRAVRFLHVISCTNMPKPLGMGLWEGVPLRDVIWLTQPKTNIRRVYYHGYHNDDPKQRFQSSLPVSRVLEEPLGELPIILCYKLNGQWLTPKRGGPVRMIVPGAYGNKSVKWIQRVVLTNDPRQNDTYAEWNNDTESQLKTCASFRSVPKKVKAGQAVSVVGSGTGGHVRA